MSAAVIIVGFLLMLGSGSTEEFNPDIFQCQTNCGRAYFGIFGVCCDGCVDYKTSRKESLNVCLELLY